LAQFVFAIDSQGGAKAIAVASSYGDGSERAFLDSPKAEWLWEFAEANDICFDCLNHSEPGIQFRSGKSKGAKPHRPISNAAGTNEPAWRLSNFEGVTKASRTRHERVTGKESMA
jgi:hypothetical protein